MRKEKRNPSTIILYKILGVVSETLGIDESKIIVTKDNRKFADARRIYCMLAKKYTKRTTLEMIGSLINAEHHLVLYYIRTCNDLYSTDKSFRNKFISCENELKRLGNYELSPVELMYEIEDYNKIRNKNPLYIMSISNDIICYIENQIKRLKLHIEASMNDKILDYDNRSFMVAYRLNDDILYYSFKNEKNKDDLLFILGLMYRLTNESTSVYVNDVIKQIKKSELSEQTKSLLLTIIKSNYETIK